MLDNLRVYNLKNHDQVEIHPDSSAFVLKTCQRFLVVCLSDDSMNSPLFERRETSSLIGVEAYQYLLEIICGLKSKLVGENEIVGQFKTAYKDYCSRKVVNSQTLIILEKLFKDAKEIRSKYLMGICQKTYASIARKHMINIHKAQDVLILGSGSLAEDLINQFKKKANVYISARNMQKVNELANKHDIRIIPWKNTFLYTDFSHIANTIGAEETLLDQEFFDKWCNKHQTRFFVDLSSGQSIESNLDYELGLMTLQDIFAEGAIGESRKAHQLKMAQQKMTEIVEKRYIHLKEKKNNQMQYGVKSERSKVV